MKNDGGHSQQAMRVVWMEHIGTHDLSLEQRIYTSGFVLAQSAKIALLSNSSKFENKRNGIWR